MLEFGLSTHFLIKKVNLKKLKKVKIMSFVVYNMYNVSLTFQVGSTSQKHHTRGICHKQDSRLFEEEASSLVKVPYTILGFRLTLLSIIKRK